MNVLVTGATGLLGKSVVAALLQRGHDVCALVRPSRSNGASSGLPDGARTAFADLRRRAGLREALKEIDAVVHLAACVVGDDDAQFASTVVGTENLLAALQGSGVKRFVHCSSFSVYDWKAARRRLTEDTPIEGNLYQRDGYAVSKTWQERLVSRFGKAGHCEVVVLRPGFIWGSGREEIAAVGHSFGRVQCVVGVGRRLPITYVENCADAFALAVDCPGVDGRVLNIVDDDLVTAWRYAGELKQTLGKGGMRVPIPYSLGMANAWFATLTSKAIFRGKGKLPGLLVPTKFRARFRPLRFPNQAAKEALGWRPRYGFEEAWRRSRDGATLSEQARRQEPALREQTPQQSEAAIV